MKLMINLLDTVRTQVHAIRTISEQMKQKPPDKETKPPTRDLLMKRWEEEISNVIRQTRQRETKVKPGD